MAANDPDVRKTVAQLGGRARAAQADVSFHLAGARAVNSPAGLARRIVKAWAGGRMTSDERDEVLAILVDLDGPVPAPAEAPGLAAVCARCGKPREVHGGTKRLGICPDQSGLSGRRFALRDEDKVGGASPDRTI